MRARFLFVCEIHPAFAIRVFLRRVTERPLEPIFTQRERERGVSLRSGRIMKIENVQNAMLTLYYGILSRLLPP